MKSGQLQPVPEKIPKEQPKSKKIAKSTIKIVGIVGAAIIIFSFGWAAGSGKLQIGWWSKPVASHEGLPADLDYKSVEEVYDNLKQLYDGQLDNNKLLDGLKQGLASASGDRYTEYFNQDAAKEFNEELNGSFTGIGAELSKENNTIVIIAPIAGFPAEQAGMRPGDVIVEIDGKSAVNMSVSDAVKQIRGPSGTKVKLVVARDGKRKDFEITRQQITVPSVKHEIKDGVGVLTISRFSEDTVGLAKQAAQEFKTANVKGVVLDLRGDPGGLLDAAVGVSSLWLDKDQTVLQEKRDGMVIKTYNANGSNTLKGVKTTVLIDEGSASASEITAGALKDNGVATLIGVKSFGKGSVQQLKELESGGLLKVTIARWYTPAGKNIDKEGISPDQEVKRTDDDITAKRDPQLEAALNSLK